MLALVLAAAAYGWLPSYDAAASLERRFPPPAGFTRAAAAPGTFAAWLRGLPLEPAGTPVLLHDGRRKARQDVHAAVIDIDGFRADLQQCADAVMRLRAEYLYGAGTLEKLRFHFTSGEEVPFTRWLRGERPRVSGSRVSWTRGAPSQPTRATLRAYLRAVFTYSGTASLPRDTVAVSDAVRAGDVFLQPGSPGHAVIVLDVAHDVQGRPAFLLAQSYMPAQDIHVLLNPKTPGSPWYRVEGDKLLTPEWTFAWTARRRFPGDEP